MLDCWALFNRSMGLGVGGIERRLRALVPMKVIKSLELWLQKNIQIDFGFDRLAIAGLLTATGSKSV